MNNNKQAELQKWFIEQTRSGRMRAHGVVTGHPKISDNTHIHTSEIMSVETDPEKGIADIITKNTTYRCSFSSCRFDRQDRYPNALKDYEQIKERYYTPPVYPEIEQGKILLVLSNFDDFCFNSLCVKDENGEKKEYQAIPHIGMFQDSFLIFTNDRKIDIRYFPNFGSISFYVTKTDGMPLFVENIGTGELVITRNTMSNKLERLVLMPGERKEIPYRVNELLYDE